MQKGEIMPPKKATETTLRTVRVSEAVWRHIAEYGGRGKRPLNFTRGIVELEKLIKSNPIYKNKGCICDVCYSEFKSIMSTIPINICGKCLKKTDVS